MLINDLSARIDSRKEKIATAIARVLDSGWVVLGPEVKSFEQAFASYNLCKHAVSLANGTDAIELSLRALGVKAGDTVATVANAGMYTTTAVLAIGASPYYLDVDLNTSNTTLAEVERALSAGVKTVVVTHLYGLATPEIFEIAAACKARGARLLEDCAQAHGATVRGQRVGSIGDIGSFSFYPTKNLGALGDGGALVTNSIELADQVRQLRQYGWSTKYKVECGGARNSRLDEIQAAILSVFLPDLDQCNARRRLIAQAFNDGINHPEIVLPMHNGEGYVAHLYVIRSALRDSLREHLRNAGISADIHYPIPDYLQPLFENRFDSVSLVNTELLSSEILTLPCYPEMSAEQTNLIIKTVNAWRP